MNITTCISECWNKLAYKAKDKKCRRNNVRNTIFLSFLKHKSRKYPS